MPRLCQVGARSFGEEKFASTIRVRRSIKAALGTLQLRAGPEKRLAAAAQVFRTWDSTVLPALGAS